MLTLVIVTNGLLAVQCLIGIVICIEQHLQWKESNA